MGSWIQLFYDLKAHDDEKENNDANMLENTLSVCLSMAKKGLCAIIMASGWKGRGSGHELCHTKL